MFKIYYPLHFRSIGFNTFKWGVIYPEYRIFLYFLETFISTRINSSDWTLWLVELSFPKNSWTRSPQHPGITLLLKTPEYLLLILAFLFHFTFNLVLFYFSYSYYVSQYPGIYFNIQCFQIARASRNIMTDDVPNTLQTPCQENKNII